MLDKDYVSSRHMRESERDRILFNLPNQERVNACWEKIARDEAQGVVDKQRKQEAKKNKKRKG